MLQHLHDIRLLYLVSAVPNVVNTDALAVRSKTCVNSRSLAGIAGSNTAKVMVFGSCNCCVCCQEEVSAWG